MLSLNRFVEAQNRCFESVISELRAGEKRSHWMWFIFPQVAGLGGDYFPMIFVALIKNVS